jgi:hypothetical protein
MTTAIIVVVRRTGNALRQLGCPRQARTGAVPAPQAQANAHSRARTMSPHPPELGQYLTVSELAAR